MKKIIVVGCTFMATAQVAFAAGGGKMKITSAGFQDGGTIPEKFTCTGANVNPPLHFADIPAQAKSLALVVDDPDAPGGIFLHWLVWNIDPKTTNIAENSVPRNAMQGRNGFGKGAYGGPCPPSGTHRYYFKVYALDVAKLEGPSTRTDVEFAIQSHAIARGELMGRYSKK
jgi:Raf kinase inhibitor-like YbhB/YbcL family protein